MQEDKKVEDAVRYFRSESVYARLFLVFKEKYESYGRIAGSVPLIMFSEEDIDIFALFFADSKRKMKQKGKITAVQFEKQLQNTRFSGIELKDVLEAFFEEPLVTKKEKIEQKLERIYIFFQQLKEECPLLKGWIDYIQKKPKDSYWIHGLAENSFVTFKKLAKELNLAVSLIPNEPMRLPVFSQKVTGNPHSFDRNMNLGKLFLHFLVWKKSENSYVRVPSDSESINELLLNVNILRDDITNYVTIANLMAEDEKGEMQAVWKAACDTHSVLNLPIRELLSIKKVEPTNDRKDVWVIENSGVFSSLLDEIPDLPLICTHGQFKLAAWKLFDVITERKITLHYAGDIDPEGLSIAERFVNRYSNNVTLWKMDTDSYYKAVSRGEKLADSRLNMLKTLQFPQLKEVKQAMCKQKLPAYQEALLDEMINELKENRIE